MLDLDGNLVEASDSFWLMLGYAPGQTASLNVKDWDAAISSDQFEARIQELIAAPMMFETKHRRLDGSVFDVEINCHGVELEGRRYLYAASRDITERKNLEEELRRSNAELEQFSYVVSHDLRQPLRMVTSYLTLIERRLKEILNEDTRQFMDFARDGAKTMDRLILDLLEYSRLGRQGAPMKPVALAEVVNEALQNLTVAIAEAKTVVTAPPELPTITGRRSDLVRLFQNLIGNGVKYRVPDGASEITIACQRDKEGWTVSIRDNGIGVPADQADRIFGVFQRLHASDAYEGTGIGLAVCRKIVEQHGGRIWVESEAGQGSDFRFTLPIGTNADQIQQAAEKGVFSIVTPAKVFHTG